MELENKREIKPSVMDNLEQLVKGIGLTFIGVLLFAVGINVIGDELLFGIGGLVIGGFIALFGPLSIANTIMSKVVIDGDNLQLKSLGEDHNIQFSKIQEGLMVFEGKQAWFGNNRDINMNQDAQLLNKIILAVDNEQINYDASGFSKSKKEEITHLVARNLEQRNIPLGFKKILKDRV